MMFSRLDATCIHALCVSAGWVSLCMCICVICVACLCFVYLNLLFLLSMVITAAAQGLKCTVSLNIISNLRPSHPAAPPLDAMALAISVGDTHDTEGRAD